MAQRKKGRDKRAAAIDEGTGLVRVKLNDEQWKGRCDDLASAIKKLEDVKGRKAAAADKFNGEIKLLEDQVSQLADEVDTHEANVDAQMAFSYERIPGGKRQPDNDADAEDAEVDGAA